MSVAPTRRARGTLMGTGACAADDGPCGGGPGRWAFPWKRGRPPGSPLGGREGEAGAEGNDGGPCGAVPDHPLRLPDLDGPGRRGGQSEPS